MVVTLLNVWRDYPKQVALRPLTHFAAIISAENASWHITCSVLIQRLGTEGLEAVQGSPAPVDILRSFVPKGDGPGAPVAGRDKAETTSVTGDFSGIFSMLVSPKATKSTPPDTLPAQNSDPDTDDANTEAAVEGTANFAITLPPELLIRGTFSLPVNEDAAVVVPAAQTESAETSTTPVHATETAATSTAIPYVTPVNTALAAPAAPPEGAVLTKQASANAAPSTPNPGATGTAITTSVEAGPVQTTNGPSVETAPQQLPSALSNTGETVPAQATQQSQVIGQDTAPNNAAVDVPAEAVDVGPNAAAETTAPRSVPAPVATPSVPQGASTGSPSTTAMQPQQALNLPSMSEVVHVDSSSVPVTTSGQPVLASAATSAATQTTTRTETAPVEAASTLATPEVVLPASPAGTSPTGSLSTPTTTTDPIPTAAEQPPSEIVAAAQQPVSAPRKTGDVTRIEEIDSTGETESVAKTTAETIRQPAAQSARETEPTPVEAVTTETPKADRPKPSSLATNRSVAAYRQVARDAAPDNVVATPTLRIAEVEWNPLQESLSEPTSISGTGVATGVEGIAGPSAGTAAWNPAPFGTAAVMGQTPAMVASPETPMAPSDFVSQTVAVVHAVPNGEEQRVMMRLDPPEMGRVMVRIRRSNDRLSVRIEAESATTLSALREQHGQLVDSLTSGMSDSSQIDLSYSDGQQPHEENTEEQAHLLAFPRMKSGTGTDTETAPDREELNFVA